MAKNQSGREAFSREWIIAYGLNPKTRKMATHAKLT